MKQLKVFASLDPTSQSVGWERDDIPVVHVFAQAAPGAAFQPSNGRGGPHWPCAVCDAHRYTAEDFEQQMNALMAAAANAGRKNLV